MRLTLFHNEGEGTFRDVTAHSGLGPPSRTRRPTRCRRRPADYDGDGWLDLFLSHWGDAGGPCHLWHNLGDGQFQCAEREPPGSIICFPTASI